MTMKLISDKNQTRRENMKVLRILIPIFSVVQSEIAEDCSDQIEVTKLPHFNSTCCEETEWLIKDQEGHLR